MLRIWCVASMSRVGFMLCGSDKTTIWFLWCSIHCRSRKCDVTSLCVLGKRVYFGNARYRLLFFCPSSQNETTTEFKPEVKKMEPVAAPTKKRERPKVGVGVFVLSASHPNCVLVGKRKSPLGQGKYGLPGGHLEFGESWEECGQREVEEETGLRLTGVRFSAVLNVVIPEENYHYIELFVQGYVDTQHQVEPLNLEPDKCEGWEWVDWDNFLPLDSVFEPLKVIRRQGYNPFLQHTPGT